MSETYPSFSVIVPTYNRPTQLRACLASLAQLTYPHDRYEVIVVDDGSPSSLDPVASDFWDALNLTLHRQQNAGPAVARNTGAAHARGRFLAFTDDDCQPAPDWLSALAAHLAEKPGHLIGGRTVNTLSKNPYSSVSQLLIKYLNEYYDDSSAQFFPSNNMAVPAERFRALGGFDTTFSLAAGEDREFCDRWQHLGHAMTYAPDAAVYHTHAMTLRSFWYQHFTYGRGAFRFHQVRRRRGQGLMAPEPPSFYWGLLRYPFVRRRDASPALQALLMSLSQVASAAGLVWEALFAPPAKQSADR